MSAFLAVGCWLFVIWLIVAGHHKAKRKPTPRPTMNPSDADWAQRVRLIGELEDQLLAPAREPRKRQP